VNVRTTHVCGRRPQTVNKEFLAKAMTRSEQDGLGIVVNVIRNSRVLQERECTCLYNNTQNKHRILYIYMYM